MLCLGRAAFDSLLLLIREPSKRSIRFAWLVLQVTPRYTMVPAKRLLHLYSLVRTANLLNLEGDIVECGVWNGGSAAMMGIACRDDKTRSEMRKLWLFDSFQGLPQPGERDGKRERDSYFEGWCRGDPKKVAEILDRFDIPPEAVKIIAGRFDSTLRGTDIPNIAVLHIDADWYDSVKVVLENLFDRVVPGGFVVFDDYWRWKGCKQAVQDYLQEHKVEGVVLRRIDRTAAYFQKPLQG